MSNNIIATNLPIATPNRRGRKSNISKLEESDKIVLNPHHFKYSDDFADKLATFAKAHLENKNKEFKVEWKKWTEQHADEIQTEIAKMKSYGYTGSVEDKMYFSARYYYRKKAIKEQDSVQEEEDKPPRKKYESIDKELLSQMNGHILSQIYSSEYSETTLTDIVVSNITPSKAYANYCKTYSVLENDQKTKKTYKNLYWRITKSTLKKEPESNTHICSIPVVCDEGTNVGGLSGSVPKR
jgi:Fe2+ transport system protein B